MHWRNEMEPGKFSEKDSWELQLPMEKTHFFSVWGEPQSLWWRVVCVGGFGGVNRYDPCISEEPQTLYSNKGWKKREVSATHVTFPWGLEPCGMFQATVFACQSWWVKLSPTSLTWSCCDDWEPKMLLFLFLSFFSFSPTPSSLCSWSSHLPWTRRAGCLKAVISISTGTATSKSHGRWHVADRGRCIERRLPCLLAQWSQLLVPLKSRLKQASDLTWNQEQLL